MAETTVPRAMPIVHYPTLPKSDPVPPTQEPGENKKTEEPTEKADTTIEINEGQSNKEETELLEDDEKDEDEREKKDTEKPLLEKEDSVKIEIKPGKEGDDTPTLPLPDKEKKSKENSNVLEKQESRLPKYLFPLSRIKDAWTDSSNVCQFIGRTVCIIFQTVGWFTCVGGIPFLSLVMLIIGSIYVDDCNIQPNIPVYLIVSGVIGTIQHFIIVWTKYVPKNSKGKLKVYRSYCGVINGLFHLFLIIWFILGCIWVYGVHSEVEFNDSEKDEYCHRTLYYFSFWILNLSFILLALLIFLSICFLICVIATDKD